MASISTRVATEDDFDAVVRFDGQLFGDVWTEEQRIAIRPLLELDRFHLAHDGDALVGVAGLFSQELTVPGGATVGAGGVTWVAVAPTHRRQGVLRTLMDDVHADVDARGEPIAILTASEGGIYERFGYGVATHCRLVEMERRRVQLRPEFQPPPGTVAMTTGDDPRLFELFDRYRRGRVGEIDRTPASFTSAVVLNGPGASVAIHEDGFAVWKLTPKWNGGHPAHEMRVLDVVANTPEAYRALWNTVLSADLVGTITSHRQLALDDELPYLLTDPRAVRTTDLNDMLWVHLRDVRRSLAARTYATIDELVVGVDVGDKIERWQVAGSPEGADVRRARRRPDLSTDRASLGAMYLGGVRPSTLARAGRVVADADVLRRADAFFAADRLPHCSTSF
ncbi:MAG: GNAT family N-acetyltransferase [Ilumatobacter sp.]|nr:GNAT family N-acetyltransferase [Ilumatobacter sp.]